MEGRKALAGEVALVTGASRGIGLATARELAKAGAAVALAARDGAACAAEAEALQEAGATARGFALDVTESEAIPATLRSVEESLGPVSILVNNAGIAFSAPLQRTTLADLRRLLEVNLIGAFSMIHAVLPKMKERGFGRIINIASSAGRTGHRYASAYAASKHGLVGLSRALALELAERGITVNAVCPGWTETELLSGAAEEVAARSGATPAQTLERLAAMNPMRRLIQPEEVARAVLFLADPAARGITGQVLGVDGGEVIA